MGMKKKNADVSSNDSKYWQHKGMTMPLYGSEDAQPNSIRFHIRDFPISIQAALLAMHKNSNILVLRQQCKLKGLDSTLSRTKMVIAIGNCMARSFLSNK